jgi:hypothetical protein
LFFGTGPGGSAVNVTNRVFTVDNTGNVASSGSLTTATSLNVGTSNFVVSATGVVTTLNGTSPLNGVIRLTPNLHLNAGAGASVILNWDNGDGGNVANLAFRVGNGFGASVFVVRYNGDTTINGTVSAANFSGPGTSLSGTAGSLSIGGTAAYATNWWSTSHNGTYYLVNNWDGTYWNLSSNHPSGVRVAYADSAGSASSASTATTASNSNALGGVAASGYAQLTGATFSGDITTYRAGSPTTGVIYLGNNGGSRYLYYDGTNYNLNGAGLIVGGTVSANLSGNVTGNLSGTASAATLAAKASTLAQNGGNGAAMTFNWSGQGGQPTYLWGSNDGVNHYVWNPSNFSVNFATSAGSASTASLSSNTNSISNAIGSSYTWTAAQSFSSAPGGQSRVTIQPGTSGGGSTSGAIDFFSVIGREGYIGRSTSVQSADSGTIPYVAGVHAFTGVMTVTGSITAQGDVVAYSDRRLKTDVQTIQDPLWKVQNLEGVTYKRLDSGEISTGLIAQDVQAVLPEAVVEDLDGILAVKYGNLAGLFVEAIKALNKEVAELRAEIKALKDAQ